MKVKSTLCLWLEFVLLIGDFVAMRKPVITQEVRVPTDIWSGMGFSRSMPESAIREQLVRVCSSLCSGAYISFISVALEEQ